jgi:hypothetical protein
MTFADTLRGLEDPWYKVETDAEGGVVLWANEQGYEHLARVFLKFARGRKDPGYHSHHPREFGADTTPGQSEWTLALCQRPKET